MKIGVLSRIGRKLYGPSWKGKMAGALSVDPATLRRWLAAGKVPARYVNAVRYLEARPKG